MTQLDQEIQMNKLDQEIRIREFTEFMDGYYLRQDNSVGGFILDRTDPNLLPLPGRESGRRFRWNPITGSVVPVRFKITGRKLHYRKNGIELRVRAIFQDGEVGGWLFKSWNRYDAINSWPLADRLEAEQRADSMEVT